MNPFAHYLELVATVQYLHGRGHVFGSDEDAFSIGNGMARSVVIAHAVTLSASVEFLAPPVELPNSARWGLHIAIWGLALSLFVFLQTNTPYLQELRERFRQEPGGSSNRERPMWTFLIGSWLLALVAGLLWIAHAI